MRSFGFQKTFIALAAIFTIHTFGVILFEGLATPIAFAQSQPGRIGATASPKSTSDSTATVLLHKIATAQFALKSYSATVDLNSTEGKTSTTAQAQIAFSKPNKVALHVKSAKDSVDLISDGKNTFTVRGDQKTYTKEAANPDSANIVAAFQTSGAALTGLFESFVTDASTEKQLVAPATLSLSSDETLDGIPVDVILLKAKLKGSDTATIEIAAGKDDHLIRRIIGTHGTTERLSELYTNVKGNPTLPEDTFAFTPKAGMTLAPTPSPIQDIGIEVEEPPHYDARLRPGAKPLAFAGTDIHGIRQTLVAHKGKVLLLEFWAMWCPPSRERIPGLVAAYGKYHTKGFDIIGVSLDKAKQKTQLMRFLQKNKMPWPQIYDGKY